MNTKVIKMLTSQLIVEVETTSNVNSNINKSIMYIRKIVKILRRLSGLIFEISLLSHSSGLIFGLVNCQ